MVRGGWLLDTNVVSELRRGPHAAPTVLHWMSVVAAEHCFLSVVTLAELADGVSTTSNPAKRAVLADWLDVTVRRGYGSRILDVGESVLVAWLALLRHGRRRGVTYPGPDALTAATAIAHGLTVVTRNTRDFAMAGVSLLDPWRASDT